MGPFTPDVAREERRCPGLTGRGRRHGRLESSPEATKTDVRALPRARAAALLSRFRVEEAVGLVFLLVLVVLSVATNHSPNLWKLSVTRMVQIAVVVAIGSVLVRRRASGFVGVLRDWLPFAVCILIYENLHDLVPLLNPRSWDEELAVVDRWMFGVDAAVWAEQFVSHATTNLMNAGYSAYYLFPPVAAGILYVRGDRARFRHVMLGIVFGLYIGYVGYMLVPAVGPRYHQADLFSRTLEGDVFHRVVVERHNAVHGGELPRDCFPSLHTAAAVTVLTFVLLYMPRLLLFFAPAAVLLICSTVYLRYHYVIDLIAGAVLGLAMVWLAPRVDGLWSRWTGAPSPTEEPPGFA
jgi:membrane-associated phospholipid phosphatase